MQTNTELVRMKMFFNIFAFLTLLFTLMVVGAATSFAVLDYKYSEYTYVPGIVAVVNESGTYTYNLKSPSTTYCCQRVLNCTCAEYLLVRPPNICCRYGDISKLVVGDAVSLFLLNDTAAVYDCVSPKDCSGMDTLFSVSVWGIVPLYASAIAMIILVLMMRPRT